jgi:acyl-CoA thioester hydrolase
MISVEMPLETQFYDLDPMSVVWHGHYARFFEQVRCRLLDKIGYSYREMETSGYLWPIVEMNVKYVASLHFPQKFAATATLLEYENRIRIGYVLKDASGKVLTKATTTQVAVKIDTGELQLISPAILIEKVKALS